MKLTIVSHDVGPVSGMERQLVALIDGLVARGVGVRVVSRSCEVASRDAVEHVRIPGPARPFAVGFPSFAAQAARIVRRDRWGVVQVAGCLAPIRADVVAIHFLHAGAARAGAAPRLPDASLPYRVNQHIAAREFLIAERWQLRPAHHHAVTAVSGGLAREVKEHYPQAADPVVIHNGVDLEGFRPGPPAPAMRSRLQPQRGKRLAVFVGGGWEPKGLRHAIRALAEAPEWALAVVGPGDRGPFEAEAGALGVVDRLRFAGVIEDMPAVYRSVDALVLPSTYETFSIVAHEAAATGCPVLATRVSGVTDIVRDGDSGFFVEPDGRSIARALERLAGMDARRAAALRAAAGAAVAGRTTDAMVEAHLALYERLGAALT